jgi:hypothetical protein
MRRGRCVVTYGAPDGFTVAVTLHQADGACKLQHQERRPGAAPIVYRVGAVSTAQPFGGVRWWFLCPVTGRRVAKLWLPKGGNRFASREAWGLGYAVQRMGELGRIDRRADRIYRSLSGPTQWRDGIPPKPRYMRWPTYSRRALALRAAIAAFNAAWVAGVARRYPGTPVERPQGG